MLVFINGLRYIEATSLMLCAPMKTIELAMIEIECAPGNC